MLDEEFGNPGTWIDEQGERVRALIFNSFLERCLLFGGVRHNRHAEEQEWQELLNVAHGHGLAGLAGSASAVGVVGYALGGGNGWLARRYGLCSDMIDAAEVVTVDGNRRWVSADAEPDFAVGLERWGR